MYLMPEQNEPNSSPIISVKQRIIQNPEFMNLHQQLIKTVVEGAIEQGELKYWQEHPELDTIGLGLDPIGLKEGAENNISLAGDLLANLFLIATKEVEIALAQHFEDK